MEVLIHLTAGFLLSFIGSLPLGVINMTVAETTIHKGIRAALFVALGASLVEMGQAFFSVKFTNLFNENPNLLQTIEWIAIPIFLLLAIYYYFSTPSRQQPQGSKKSLSPFPKGILVSLINVMVYPYWIFYGTYLAGEGIIYRTDAWIFIFSIGVLVGTFSLLMLYSFLSLKIIERIKKAAAWTNKIIAFIFLIFAVIQGIKIGFF